MLCKGFQIVVYLGAFWDILIKCLVKRDKKTWDIVKVPKNTHFSALFWAVFSRSERHRHQDPKDTDTELESKRHRHQDPKDTDTELESKRHRHQDPKDTKTKSSNPKTQKAPSSIPKHRVRHPRSIPKHRNRVPFQSTDTKIRSKDTEIQNRQRSVFRNSEPFRKIFFRTETNFPSRAKYPCYPPLPRDNPHRHSLRLRPFRKERRLLKTFPTPFLKRRSYPIFPVS